MAFSARPGSTPSAVCQPVVVPRRSLETATLTLVKDVPANALGVTADGWDLTFAGPAGATGTGITGAGVVTTVEVPAGDYSLSEALTAATASDINYQQYGLESLICEVNGQASADAVRFVRQ